MFQYFYLFARNTARNPEKKIGRERRVIQKKAEGRV